MAMLLYALFAMFPVVVVAAALLTILISVANGGAPGMPIADEDLPGAAPTDQPRARAA
jgi:hypothetical protein